MGLFRLAIDTPIALIDGFAYDEGTLFWIINNIFFQYYSLLIFLVSAVTMVVVSYATSEPSYEQIRGLTFDTLSNEEKAVDRAGVSKWDIIMTGIVILLIVMAYLYFTG